MANYLELSVSHKDKNGKNRYTKVGAAFPSKHIEGAFNVVIDPGISISSGEGLFINLNPPREKEDGGGGGFNDQF